MSKPKWLSRMPGAPGPNLMLCLSQAEFDRASRQLKTPRGPWLHETAYATVHHYQNEDNEIAAVVCLRQPSPGVKGADTAAVLVHEAVHIWQAYAEFIGEDKPGAEQEAYAIQFFSAALLHEYARRITEAA